jgi:hypothetical protein
MALSQRGMSEKASIFVISALWRRPAPFVSSF